ncbi:aminotransferase [Anaerobacterium chartisolvens]|uniref:Aminotransferase n=1 Tax=Anaerobacterium chartisolvens TaxID=1297424 RepID=A0A369B972_9FIRM|nr:aminotransferase class I/II-fold pyridoxal phosphate-dependent enzyme [Anaerobacterium chartisolvens]RCX17951.1 aminotransferase [Anaerobacterium chartisolvens]
MIIEDMICENIRNTPPSGIRKYFDLINEMQGVISLGVGEPDFITPWNIREAGIYSLERGHTQYSSNAGFIELRSEIAAYQRRKYGLEYSWKDEILVTVGGSEAIDAALRVLAGPGDEVIIPEPSFVAYKGCTYFSRATPVTINLKSKNKFRLTAEELENAITDRTKVIILPFPNNPTGGIMEREDLEKIASVLRNKNVIVISDEIYSELTYEGTHVSIASLPGMREKTVVINGFSKAFAMTGWRLGYVCGHPEIIGAMKKVHQYALMCAPTVAQDAAIEALKNSDGDVEMMRKEYNHRRRVMVDGFKKAGLECFEPKGAFYVFPSIKSTGMKSDEFCERLLMQEKVLVVPGSTFGECGEGFIRACYAASMENIYEALKRIKRFIEGAR